MLGKLQDLGSHKVDSECKSAVMTRSFTIACNVHSTRLAGAVHDLRDHSDISLSIYTYIYIMHTIYLGPYTYTYMHNYM